jgi:PEP-CTERM motif
MTLCHRLIISMTVLMLGVQSARADLLSGTVSFNPQTHLYTYSYTLSHTGGGGGGLFSSDFGIKVGPPVGTLINGLATANALPQPIATTTPDGWRFSVTSGNYGGGSSGTYWTWSPISINRKVSSTSGFSFTTAAPPAILTPGVTNDSVSVFGNVAMVVWWQNGQVVAPDLGAGPLADPLIRGAASAPEPSSLTLLALGAFGLLGYSWRRIPIGGTRVRPDC